jgi:hypothetical protein
MFVIRAYIGLVCAGVLALSITSPAFAYGKENWQTTFAGTAVTPGGSSFGFWGWCAFGGGTSSGNHGDCQFAEYVHGAAQGSFTCHESLDISSWRIGPSPAPGVPGDFLINGTVTVTPSNLTGPCIAFFPGNQFMTGSNTFANADSGIPGAAGHYNLTSGFLGANQVGELQEQVTQIP